MKTLSLIAHVGDWQDVYRNTNTGIAFVQDGNTGMRHSCHANISSGGSIRGMKEMGYWGKKDRTVKCNGYIYNVDTYVVTDKLDAVAAEYCQCIGCQDRRANQSYK